MRMFNSEVYKLKSQFVLRCLSIPRCKFCYRWDGKRCTDEQHPKGSIYPEVEITKENNVNPGLEV